MVSLSMVQKTTKKVTDQRLLSCRNVPYASKKHCPFFIDRMALRELPNESGSFMESPLISVLPKEATDNSDSSKLIGNKRQPAECSPTQAARYQLQATNGSTGHFVYVRRKIETEQGKTNAASNDDTACSSGTRKFSIEGPGSKDELQQEENVRPNDDEGKTCYEAASLVELQNEISNYWAERYKRLQNHLQYLDKSGSKDYAEKFRTFSVDELNRHAIELEKRAIRLSLEEALQSKCVKDLNLLGKYSE